MIADGRVKLRHLNCFLEVTRRGSLIQAADALGLTQPAVSKNLKELEEVLGVVLLERSRSGVALTPAGELFLHYAGSALAALRQGLDAVAQARMAGEALLTIGALPSVAARVIPRAVARFHALRPGVVPSIITGPNPYLLEQLRLGALDLVVGRLGSPEMMAGLSFTQLYAERVALVVRPGHPLLADPDIGRLAEFPVLLPNKGAAIRPIAERFLIANGLGVPPERIETVADTFGRAYVRASDAVWIISYGVVALDLAEGHLAELPFDMAQTLGPVGLTTRADAVATPALLMFTAALREVAATA